MLAFHLNLGDSEMPVGPELQELIDAVVAQIDSVEVRVATLEAVPPVTTPLPKAISITLPNDSVKRYNEET